MYERICKLAEKKGVTIAQVERDLGFSAASLRKIDTNRPGSEKVMALAKYFGVSTDYLCGNTDIEKTADQVLDPDFISLQRARQRMSEEVWSRAMDIIRAGFASAFRDD